MTNADEKQIVLKLVGKLRSIGYKALNNVVVDGIELDVIAIDVENQHTRPLVYLFEVKSRPKPKFAKQMTKRIAMADYLYAVVPFNLYPWVLKKLDERIGLVIYINDDLHIFRSAKYIGNGKKVLGAIFNLYTLSS